MRIASIVLSFAALGFTLIGTSEFLPVIQSAAIEATAWIAATFLKLVRLPWEALLRIMLEAAIALGIRNRHEHRVTGDIAGATDFATAWMTHSIDELPIDEWRQAVNKQMRAMAEQLGETKAELAATKAALRAETLEQVNALQEELRASDRRRLLWVTLGISCQIIASALALFADP